MTDIPVEDLEVKEIPYEPPGVIDIRTRLGWSPPPDFVPVPPAEKEVDPNVDQTSIDCLTIAFADVKAGRVGKVIVIGLSDDPEGIDPNITLYVSDAFQEQLPVVMAEGMLKHATDQIMTDMIEDRGLNE